MKTALIYESIKNMEVAVREITDLKLENRFYRFRIETCINKPHVKLYVIKKTKIVKVITIAKQKILVEDK